MGETPRADAELHELVLCKINKATPRMRGVSPFKIPVWFKLVSYYKPPVAFKNSPMREFVGSYKQIGMQPPFKRFIVLLNASQN
jgi:hypothetical protein